MMKYTEENPLRVFTTFSGYDSQCLALRKAGIPFDLIGWSEIEKRAILAHDAIFPEYKDRNYGDICKIDWTQVPDFDFFTYSSPCFIAGTVIQTDNGLKNIEDIKAGDYVLTHTNTYHKVIQPMKRGYCGDLYHIKSANGEIVCTPEHPFYVRELSHKYVDRKHPRTRVFGEPVWKNAKNIKKGDYLGTPVNNKSVFPQWNGTVLHNWGHNKKSDKLSRLFTNKNFWYLMGRYVGDGWRSSTKDKETGEFLSKSIKICCSKKKKYDKDTLINAIEDCGFNYCVVEERTVFKIQIVLKELWEFVERYGNKADGKFIDIDTINLPVEYLEPFVSGYIDSDGSFDEKNNTFGITTVSKKLAYTFGQCVNKVYHRAVRIQFCKLPEKHIIEGREVNQKSFYRVSFKKENTKQDQSFFENWYIWSPVNTHKNGIFVENVDDCFVYNMEVDVDNSYVANNYIVHNCQSFSIAGQRLGGEEGSGTKSSLLWECKKAIEIKKPKYLMLENVKMLVSRNFMPTFMKWVDFLDSLGYISYWKVLCGLEYGVPQDRRRVYMVSIMNPEMEFKFPKPIGVKTSVEDYMLTKDELGDELYEKLCVKKEIVDNYVHYNKHFLKFAVEQK